MSVVADQRVCCGRSSGVLWMFSGCLLAGQQRCFGRSEPSHAYKRGSKGGKGSNAGGGRQDIVACEGSTVIWPGMLWVLARTAT